MDKKSHSDAEFNAYKDIYTDEITNAISFIGQDQDFFTRLKAQYLLSIFRSFGRPIKVLDVGCGHGLIHPYLLGPLGVDIDLYGIDPAQEVIEKARVQNPSVSYQAVSGQRLPFPDNSFDAAYAICVLHHVPPQEWEPFLVEMKRVISPNGKIVIFEHNPWNPVTQRVVKNCPIDEDAVLLNVNTLNRLLKKAAFGQVKSRFISFTPFETGIFKLLEKSLGWLPLGAQYYSEATK